ncbi:MAG: single-stranded-DNA-specific exonuclease RecJ [Cyclobacteriaceae bacterium]|nr:MAG: single-stranded-DNA-specific exonuclease RecJ [Cyclobacteriaceae bacterium]
MQRKWVYKNSPEDTQVGSLAADLNIHPKLAALLIQRGVDSFKKARTFFRPSPDHLHDPFLMKDMHLAVQCVVETIQAGKKILIYGDYDVDGTTAVAMVFDFLTQHYKDVDYYIPDRYTEGYGLSEAGLQYAIDQHCHLIITLDCGIKAVDLVAKGVASGLQFIICDHHLPGKELPPAVAILNAKQAACAYPFKELTGCGVGFKLISAICMNRGIRIESVFEYLDLVAVSIAADIVPITGENRVLSYYGLRKLNHKPRAGLQALLDVGGIKHQVDIPEVVFGLAPRINAAGRIDHAKSAVKLLLSHDKVQAANWAGSINKNNNLRKETDSSITKEALSMIEGTLAAADLKSTVLFKEDWHKGVIGIVASRCIEKYYRPTIILTQSQDKATGSARSVPGFDIYEAISECSDLLDGYGGHKYAAGLTMPLDKISEFQRRFEKVVSATISEELLTPVLEIDLELELDSIQGGFYKVLSQIGPFGPGNMPPVFVSRGLKICPGLRVLKQQHLKFRVRSDSGNFFDGIAFGMAHYAEALEAGSDFDMAYSLEMNTFRGEQSLQMMVKDIKLTE